MKTALRRILKPLALAADRLHRPAPGVTVLLYHRVGAGTESEVDLPAEDFDRQIAELAAGDRVISLDEALGVLSEEQPLPDGERPVVITFDDGTWDFAENAVPILAHHGVPATLYVATRAVEHAEPFWADGSPPLRWEGLAAALDTGLITIGSHTHSHALLDRLETGEIAAELDRSLELISDRLGVEARHFAYPKALPPSAHAEAEVRRRFRSAALAGTTANQPGDTNPYRLARSPIQVSDGMRYFRCKADGGMQLEDRARALLNRSRYSGAVT